MKRILIENVNFKGNEQPEPPARGNSRLNLLASSPDVGCLEIKQEHEQPLPIQKAQVSIKETESRI